MAISNKSKNVASIALTMALAVLSSFVASAEAPMSAPLPERRIEILPPAKVVEAQSSETKVVEAVKVSEAAAPVSAPMAFPAPAPVPQLPTMALSAASIVNSVPVKVIYVSENQPVQIVDHNGRLLQVIYLKKK